jgi:hypothetical protein
MVNLKKWCRRIMAAIRQEIRSLKHQERQPNQVKLDVWRIHIEAANCRKMRIL